MDISIEPKVIDQLQCNDIFECKDADLREPMHAIRRMNKIQAFAGKEPAIEGPWHSRYETWPYIVAFLLLQHSIKVWQ